MGRPDEWHVSGGSTFYDVSFIESCQARLAVAPAHHRPPVPQGGLLRPETGGAWRSLEGSTLDRPSRSHAAPRQQMLEPMTDFLIFLSRFLRLLHFVRGALGALLLLLGVCALALMWAEGLPLGDALYLTAVTGLTIGYGDIAPASPLGRIACVTAGLIGVVFVGLVVAVATRALAQAVKDNSEGR